MTDYNQIYQRGEILHDAVMGAFRASGDSFEVWCKNNDTTPSTARNVTYGQMKGPIGRALLNRLITEAGPDVVHVGYMTRLHKHYAFITKEAA